jgi:hypothetical protein
MIRRLFWLGAGALLGVAGYRRITRLARTLPPPGRWGRRAALFARDVREGMDEYADRHPRLAGRTLEGQQPRAQHARPATRGDDEQGRAYPSVDYAKEGR